MSKTLDGMPLKGLLPFLEKGEGMSGLQSALDTPADLVFDDEPIEFLLYGGEQACCPTPANIYTHAQEAWRRIRQAIDDGSPYEALLITGTLDREGGEIPLQMSEELTLFRLVLGDSPSELSTKHCQDLPKLTKLGFDCHVRGDAKRCQQVWTMVERLIAAESDRPDERNHQLVEIAEAWWRKYPSCFPATAGLFHAAGLGPSAPVSSRNPNAAALRELSAMVLSAVGAANLQTGLRLKIIATAVMATAEAAGPHHASVATCLNLLVCQFFENGGHSRVIKPGRHALSIRERTLGLSHAAVAQSLNNLGLCLVCCKQYAEAEPMLERAVEIYPTFPNPHYWLARLYQSWPERINGDREAAEWRRYLELGGTTEARKAEATARLTKLQSRVDVSVSRDGKDKSTRTPIPWHRRGGVNKGLILVGLLVPPFLWWACLNILTGDIYARQSNADGSFPKWHSIVKLAILLLAIVQGAAVVAAILAVLQLQ